MSVSGREFPVSGGWPPPLRRHLSLSPNQRGRDFFVGDLHGYRSELERQLRAQDFDAAADRVIAVGDLVDRGPDSFASLALVQQPWFFSALGNHELMWIEALAGDDMGLLNVAVNGGDQLLAAMAERGVSWARAQLRAALDNMAFAISVPLGPWLIGVTHGEPPPDWGSVDELALDDWQQLVWVRERFLPRAAALQHAVAHVDAVAVGHTPGRELRAVANVVCIDTGVFLARGHLSVVEGDELLACCRGAQSNCQRNPSSYSVRSRSS